MPNIRTPSACAGEQKPGRCPGFFASGLPKSAQGFTLTELIVVIVMAGIMMAVILPRWQGDTGFEGRGFRDETVAALRYAQKSAIAARRTTCVAFTATQLSVRVSNDFSPGNCLAGAGTALLGPRDEPLVVTATGSAAYTSAPGDRTFDAQGRPNGGATISVTGLPATLAITVEAETGYVH